MIKNYSSLFIYRRLKFVKLQIVLLFILCVFIFLTGSFVYGQVAQTDLIETKFDAWRQDNLQEKIFVHTDKATYVTGEICWFKIYNVDAYNHQPIDLGKVAYVEILDKNNLAVLQAKVALENGLGDGSLYLPATLLTGNYKMRAYTNWMKNYGADYFFEKKLQIINGQRNVAETKTVEKPLYDVGFFPEGGNLVNGLQSKVGFKVNNQWGKGVNFDAVLLNEKGDTITSFHPLKFGMGSFTFTPLAGSQYKAVIKFPGGEQQVKMLQAAYNSGYIMWLENAGKGQIKIKVQTNDAANGYPVFLFVHTRNIVKVVLTKTIQNGHAEFLTDDAQLGDGISQFTIFNSGRQPVCERLYFKKPHQNLQIAAVADQQLYGLRRKINISINFANEDGQDVSANMSMAVYRIDSLESVDECAINNYLLLSSDIAGTVESPAYYFIANNDTVIAAADNLMLTQGWRRFKWDDVLQNKKPSFQFLPEMYGHIISGKITPLHPGLQVKDVAAYLTVPGLRTQFQTAAADAAGKIKFDMKNLYSDGDIIVQTNNEKDSGYRVEIDTPFFNSFSQKPLAAYNFSGQSEALLKRYISTQVQNTFLYNQLNHSTEPLLDTNAFYSRPDATYLLDNYVRFTTLEEVFREYVMEVNVRKHGGRFYLPVYDAGTKTIFSKDPLVLLNGLPVFDLNKIMSYDPLKIRKLEVMSRKYFLRDNSFEGIINLTSYKGDMEGFEIDPRATIINYEGLQLQRDFYAPVYATTMQQQSRMPDFRNLLFWTPELITNAQGWAQTSFYTSDVPGKYVVVIEGLSKDGRLGQKTIYFDVKK